MIPSDTGNATYTGKVYQRGLVIDSQHALEASLSEVSVSKGIGD